MLAPLVVGVLFFVFSAIWAFYKVETSVLPEDFQEVNLKITDYQIQQIDEKSNTVKWVLKAEQAETSTDESQAEITKPQLKFFDNAKEKFTIDGDFANLDKAKQEIVITENVTLKTTNSNIVINTNKMFFSEDNPFVEFSDQWKLLNKQGYLISGLKGKLSKNHDTIVSVGNASLSKQGDNFKISADSITLELASATPVKARSNAILDLTQAQKLYAGSIDIASDGGIKANTNVKVITPTLECYSTNLKVIPKADKNPQLAIFTGNPHIIQGGNKIYADVIKYDFDTGEAHIEGNVHSG